NPYAHFCLGIILEHQGNASEAAPHFEEVTRIDPRDAHSWYHLGLNSTEDSDQKKSCFAKAIALDPYLNSAIYGLAMETRAEDSDKAKKMLAQNQAFKDA